MQTQSESSKQSSNEHLAGCQQKLTRDTRKRTKQGRPSQLPANLKASRWPSNQKHPTAKSTKPTARPIKKTSSPKRTRGRKQSRRKSTACLSQPKKIKPREQCQKTTRRLPKTYVCLVLPRIPIWNANDQQRKRFGNQSAMPTKNKNLQNPSSKVYDNHKKTHE